MLAGVSGIQILVQSTAALSGLLLVHVLDKPQFAAYAIGASLFSLLNVLTDCGIGTGLNVLGSRAWRDRLALGSLVTTALRFRARLGCFTLPLLAGLGLILFRQNQMGWADSLTLILTAVLGFWGITTFNTYAVALRLAGRYLEVQGLELQAALVRLALLGSLSLVYLNAMLAVLTSSASVTLQALWIRRSADTILQAHTTHVPGREFALGKFVRQQWFSTWFFAFQGQITLWLMALFGDTEKVAALGALGRLAMIFAFITSLLNVIVTPALARCNSFDRLRRLCAAMLLAYALFASILLAAGFGFPREIVWILGGRYSALASELPLVIATSVVWGLTGVLYSFASARGWIWCAWSSPLLTILLQALLLTWLDLTSVRGVLVFGLLSSLPVLFSVAGMVGRGFVITRDSGQSLCFLRHLP